ncbi:MAG: tetratricopeptide repeat protein [Treponema sp.]|jgi:tetratricopeptide (TPR) repeat protein|nr:tetratricopeptide repeat protein [Treponema sp.]
MKLDPVLTKAVRFLKRGNFGKTIQLLEGEVLRYRDSFNYYYILASACLRVGDFGGALTYFKRAREIKLRDPLVMTGLAALFLRRGETDRAVDFYLEVQDLDPHNKIAKKALKVIKKNGGNEKISAWIDSGRLPRLYPPVPKLSLASNRLFLSLCVLIAVAGGAALLVRFDVIRPFRPGAEREGFAGTILEQEEQDAPFQIDGSYRYVLSRDEVLDAYAKARKLFANYRDEEAKVALNRILESNAPEGIKNKARLLFSYTGSPGFDTLSEKDSFKYAEVMEEPSLYRDCYVIWRGMAANPEIHQDSTAFTFLVGYDTRTILEGKVPVEFGSAIPVNPEQPLTLLARVIPVTSPAGMDIRLEGVAIQQVGLLQPSTAERDGGSR